MDVREIQELIDSLRRQGNLTQENEKRLKKLIAQQKEVERQAARTQDSFRDFQESLDEVGEGFGLRIGRMFEQIEVEVEQASRDIATMFDDLQSKAPDIAASIGEEFNSSFRNALPDPKDIHAQINLNSLISEFKSSFPEMGTAMQKAFKTGDIASFYKKFGDEGMKTLQQFLKDKKGFQGLREYFKPGGEGEKGTVNFRKQLESFEPAAQKTTKVIFHWNSLFKSIGDNLLNYIGIRKLIDGVMDFDKRLANIKKEFQIPVDGFAKASVAMRDLTVKGAQFGLKQEEAFAMVKKLGEEAKSTNVVTLSQTAQALAAIPQATGIAAETVGDIAGKMMFFGANAERAKGAFVSIQKSAARFGLNVTSVAKKFNEVFPRYARMGFKGGEESLARMAAKAEKMGVDLGKMLDMSDKFLDINEAIEASADLSLLGGAAAQVSFIDLMRAAQEGGDALINITNKMTSDIGKLNSKGELQLTMIDRQKIKKIAEATGQDVEGLTNQINSRLQDQAKKAALPPGLFSKLKPEEQDFLLSKVVNKGGKWQFEGMDGVKDLKTVGSDQIKAMMAKAESDAKNTEKAAQNRRSLEESFAAMTDTFVALMNSFQPILQQLTFALNKIMGGLKSISNVITKIFGESTGKWVKAILGLSAVLLLTFGPSAMARFAGILFRGIGAPLKMLSGFGAKLTSAFKGVGGGAGKIAEKVLPKPPSIPTPPTAPGAGMGGFMKSMPNPATILSIAAAMVALGVALLLVGKGIQFAATGLATLVKSFNDTKNAGAALGAIALVMGGFVAMVYILATASTVAALPLLGLGAAMLMLGGAVYLAAKGFAVLVPAIIAMGKNIWATFKGAAGLIALGAALAIISPALIIFGAASLIAVPGMVALGLLLQGLGAAKGVNPKLISQIGSSMGSIAWGLVKLGLASGPALLAIVSATALIFVSNALKNIGAVDVKKVNQFGQSMSAMSLSMIAGLAKLALVGLYVIPAVIAAGGIWAISKALANIAPVNLANLKLFGQGMAQVGSAIMFGLVKLTLISPFVAFGVIAAGGINLISKLLKGVVPVDLKALNSFGKALGAVSASMIWGLLKLQLVSVLVPLALVAAGGINLIARLLKGTPVLDMKQIGMTASTIARVSGRFAVGLLKLGLVSVLTPLALLAALGILGVTKMLKAVPTLNSKTLTATAGVVSKIVWPFTKAFLKLQPLAAFTPLALVAAAGILGVTKMLKAVPMLNPAFLIVTSQVLSKIAWPFTKSLAKLGALSIFTPFAILAAMGILKVTKYLSQVVPLNPTILTTIASTLNAVSGRLGKSLFKLGLVGFVAVPALLAAKAINSITKVLSTITPLNPALLLMTGLAISISSNAFTKGLKRLGFLGFLAIPALMAAKSINLITKFLSNITPLNPVTLTVTGVAIAISSVAFAKGLKRLALIGFVAIPALLAAKAIFGIVNTLARVPALNPMILITNSTVLSIIAPTLSAGLKKISGLIFFAGIAAAASTNILKAVKNLAAIPSIDPIKLTITAFTLARVSGPLTKGLSTIASMGNLSTKAAFTSFNILFAISSLAKLPMLNPVKLFVTARTLLLISGPLTLGLKKIASISPFSSSAAKVSFDIFRATIFLSAVKPLDPAKFQKIGEALESSAGPISKGLLKLSAISLVANKAVQAASTLRRVTFVLMGTLPVDLGKMTKIANSLTNTAGPISIGLMKFSAAGFLAGKAVKAANSLLKITKLLSNLSPVNEANLKKLATTLSVSAWPLTKGLGKFSGLSLVVLPAVAVAEGLNKISRNLSSMPVVNAASLKNLASTLSSTSGKLFWGLTKFSASALPIVPAIAVAEGVKYITKQLSQVIPIDTKKLSNIASSLFNISPTLSKGFVTFAKMGLSIFGAILAAKGIVSVTNNLKNAIWINSKKLLNIGDTLYYASPNLSKGFITFSRAGYFAGPAIVAARSLIFITRLLQRTVPLNFAKLMNIGTVLNTTSLAISQGMRKLSLALPFVNSAIRTARGLVPLSRFLSMVVFVPMKNMQQLGQVLNSTSGAIVKGLTKFLGIRLLVSPAITSAKRLIELSKNLNQIQSTNAKNLNQLATVTSSTSWKLSKALFKFSGIRTVTSTAISAAQGLVTLTKTINKIETIFYKNLLQLANVLGARSIPIVKALGKFSLISPTIPTSVLSAKGLVSLTKTINQIQQIFFKNLMSIGNVLNNTSGTIKTGLLKFSGVLFFVGPAILSAMGVRKLSRILIGIIPIPAAPLTSLSILLNSTASQLISGLQKWAGMTSLILSASLAAFGVTRIFRSLSSIANIKLDNLAAQIPILDKMIAPIMKFSSLGTVSTQLIIGGIGLRMLGSSLKTAAAGFTAFASVPWSLFTTALPTINALTSTLISFGAKGLFASTGIRAMASSLNVLGKSLNNVSSSFASSTKSMSDYNSEKDRLRKVATAPKPGGYNEINLIQRAKAAAAMGMQTTPTKTEVGVAGAKKEVAGTQVVQIKPIQIDLKLNGRQLQSLLVEANYNRT